MNLEIVLRTCDVAEVHVDWRKRYCTESKNLIVKRCVQSLINSCQHSVYELNLIVLDDHSSDETASFLYQTLKTCAFSTDFISLDQKGYNHSAHQQYILCRDSAADLVYSIEDDYLHCPSAITEMIESHSIFASKLDKPIVLYPFDEPTEYPPTDPCFLVHGSHRHWRTGNYTSNVLMTKPALFKEHWPLFEVLATKYNGNYLEPRTEHYEEANTIWNIWRQGHAIRFNPVPSLALHMQFDPQKDPFIDWRYWWDNYTSGS